MESITIQRSFTKYQSLECFWAASASSHVGAGAQLVTKISYLCSVHSHNLSELPHHTIIFSPGTHMNYIICFFIGNERLASLSKLLLPQHHVAGLCQSRCKAVEPFSTIIIPCSLYRFDSHCRPQYTDFSLVYFP